MASQLTVGGRNSRDRYVDIGMIRLATASEMNESLLR